MATIELFKQRRAPPNAAGRLAPCNDALPQTTESGIHVRELNGICELLRFQSEWRALTVSARSAAPFLQPEWIAAWWEAFGGDRELRVITAWQSSSLVGAIPLMLSRERRYGLLVRHLSSLTNEHSPRSDMLVARGVQGAVEAIWHHIAQALWPWDVFEIADVPSGSCTLASLTRVARESGCRSALWRAGASPFIDTDISWPEYLAARSRNFRKEVRRKDRLLARRGRLRMATVTDPAEAWAAARTGFQIEADGWKGRAGSAILSTESVHRFYINLACHMARRNALRLHFLTLDDKPIAFDYSLEFDQRLYSLKSGYLEAHADDSPGQVLLGRMLQHYMQDDIAEIDLLGEEDAFKRRWTDQSRTRDWFVACAPTLRGQIVYLVKYGFIPALKRLRRAATRLALVCR